MTLTTLSYAMLFSAFAVGAEIPAGTVVTVRLVDGVDSAQHAAGQIFRASLDEAVMVDGVEAIPKGAMATVRLVEAEQGGRFHGRSVLTLDLASITYMGNSLNVSSYRAVTSGSNRLKRTGVVVGGAAFAGAVVGGAATGGIATGALIGAGGGGVYQFMRKGANVKIPSESRLRFTLAHPLTM